jgi:hypothetical protein
MKNKHFLSKVLLLCAMALYIISCDEQEVEKTAYGDALVQVLKQNDTIKYALCFWTYSYYQMEKVTANAVFDSTNIITLDSVGNSFTFSFIPDSLQYTLTKPASKTYYFDVTFKTGEKYTAKDFLDSVFLSPITFKRFEYDAEDQILYVDWEKDPVASYYRIILQKENNEVVYQSSLFNYLQSSYWITKNDGGWISGKQPEGGEKYKGIILAFQYEKNGSDMDMQSISLSESEFFNWETEIY